MFKLGFSIYDLSKLGFNVAYINSLGPDKATELLILMAERGLNHLGYDANKIIALGEECAREIFTVMLDTKIWSFPSLGITKEILKQYLPADRLPNV